MKQRLTKKFVSMFLAVMMIVTSIPFSGLTAFAATADEIYDGLDAEFRSHQVGFFFSDANHDPQYDKISGTNKLKGSGATWDSAEGGFKFNGDNADHLYIKASDILSKVTAETGFTIHFEAKSLSYDLQRYFDFMCSEPLGTGDTYYLCASPNGGGKVCVKHSNGASGYLEMEQIGGMNTSDGQWHTYTIAVSNSTVEVWVDGKAYASRQDGLIDSAWFNQMRDNGYIRFGISAFSSDPAYDGCLKNVHIYDVAYTEPAYLFAYFTGDDDQADAVNQRIRFALSKDGVNFTSINGNAPILKNDQVSGTVTWNNKTGMDHTKGVRDPFIIKKVNEPGYFVVATDLRVGENGGSYNNSKIVVWDINDLSKADKAIPWNVETSGMFGSTYYSGSTIDEDYIAWAPEVTYDYQNNIYMMYWSGPLYSNSTILYAYTHDFKTFYQDPQATKTIDGNTYKPKTLFSESGKNVIDADIVFDGSNYYMVYKRESEKQLYFVKSSTIEGITSQTGTKFVDSRFTGTGGNGEGLEGPELYKNSNGKWTLIADNYTANTGAGSKGIFYMYQVDSLDEFMTGADCSSKSVSTNISDCSPRHGSVTTISSGVFASLNKEYGGVSDAKGALVARYFTSSDTKADTSGNGYNMEFPNNGISYVPEFKGVKNCVHFDATEANTAGSNPIYARVSTKQMMADYNFNYYDGLTMTWKAYDEGNDPAGNGYNGLFSLTETPNATPGTMSEDTTNYTHYDTAYAFLLAGLCRGVSSGTAGAGNGTTIYASKPVTGQWVDYKLVITGKGYKVYRNGEIAVDNNNKLCEMAVDSINQQWYLDLFTNGTLLLGTTLFGNDKNYKGYMADFRIYATGNQDSVKALEEEVANQDAIAESAEAKAYDVANVKNAAVQTVSNQVKYYGNKSTGINVGISNGVLYSSNTYTDANLHTWNMNGSDNTNMQAKVMAGSNRIVFLYNGDKGIIRVPAVAEYHMDGGTVKRYHANYLTTNSSDWTVNVNWQAMSAWNNWTTKSGNEDGVYVISYDPNHNTTDFSSNKGGCTNNWNYKNIINYNGSLAFTDYVATLTNPRFKTSVDTVIYYWHVRKAKYVTEYPSNAGHNDIAFGNNGTTPTYKVLNYQPMANIITEIKSNGANGLSSIANNEWMYEEASLARYYLAVRKVLQYNVTAYDYSNDTGLNASAKALKEAVEGYSLPTKKKINVDFAFADGTVTTETINAGDTLENIIPANTPAAYNNNKLSHMIYTWSEGCEPSHMPTEDEAYFEVFATEECSFNQNTTTAPTCEGAGLATFTCPVCKGWYTDSVPALGHKWSSTYKSNKDGTHRQVCQNDNSHILDTPCNLVETDNGDGTATLACNICGYSKTVTKLNRVGYDQAVNNARNVILKETAKYSADSLKALQDVLNKAATDSLNVETQEALDAITATIITANKTTVNGGVLVANTFRITYGNLFDYNEFMSSDSKNISNPEWGTIDFDIANQVFTVTGSGAYITKPDGDRVPANDVYSAYNGAGTYKIPVTEGTSYTFEFTAKGSANNQAFVFFYDENGNPIYLDSSYAFTETIDGVETPRASKNDEYFINKYGAPVNKKVQLTFTAPETCTSVDFRFGVTEHKSSTSFNKIGFYETSNANNFIVADNVEYGTDFGAIAISTPDVDGMHFGGWFVDKECSTSVTTIGTVTENINLYAKLHPYVVKEEVGCTLVNNGYTVYVCSGDCADSEMTAYDDKLLDGKTNGYWDAYNNLVALVTAEEGNGYANYTKASVDAVKKAYTDLHTTACASYKQSEVDGYANEMKAIINQLVVKVNFVVKENGGVDKTVTQEIPYKGAVDLLGLQVEPYTTVDGRYTWTFSGWDKQIETANITTGATYVAQYTSVDNALAKLDAYNAAVSDAQNSIKNTAKYTEASRNDLQKLLDSIIINENSTMAVIDAATTRIITANQLKQGDSDKDRVLALMKYDVEFYYVLDNAKAVKCTTGNAYVDYGTEFELKAPAIEENGSKINYSVIKWTRTTYPNNEKPKEELVGSSNETLKGRYTGKTTYYVYLKKIPTAQESTKTANIYLTDRLGRVIDAMTVALTDGSATVDVTVNGNEININNSVTMTAPNISFYTVSGFSINKTPVTNGPYTINADTYITVAYTPATSFTIECDDTTCYADKTTAQWDDKVTVTANDGSETTQWYVNGELVGYGPKYVFRANQNVSITCKNKEVTLLPSAAVSRLSYNEPTEKTITVVGSFNLPDGYTLVETGVLLKTSAVNNNNEVMNKDNYVLGGNAKKFVATYYTKDTHQFTVNVYSSKQYDKIYLGAVAYVTYKDANGIKNTVYSSLVNTDYNNGVNTQKSTSQEVA